MTLREESTQPYEQKVIHQEFDTIHFKEITKRVLTHKEIICKMSLRPKGVLTKGFAVEFLGDGSDNI